MAALQAAVAPWIDQKMEGVCLQTTAILEGSKKRPFGALGTSSGKEGVQEGVSAQHVLLTVRFSE